MMNIVSSAYTVFFLGALAIHAMPAETVANAEVLQPSFDIAMPAPTETLSPLEPPVRMAAKT